MTGSYIDSMRAGGSLTTFHEVSRKQTCRSWYEALLMIRNFKLKRTGRWPDVDDVGRAGGAARHSGQHSCNPAEPDHLVRAVSPLYHKGPLRDRTRRRLVSGQSAARARPRKLALAASDWQAASYPRGSQVWPLMRALLASHEWTVPCGRTNGCIACNIAYELYRASYFRQRTRIICPGSNSIRTSLLSKQRLALYCSVDFIALI